MMLFAFLFALAAPWVNPFIGTDRGGNTFPGACWPKGLVQASPDCKRTEGYGRPSGYAWRDTTIDGFSQTHLSGTGCPDLGDVLLFPFVEGTMTNGIFRSGFSHRREQAQAGWYSVELDDAQAKAEATASEHVAFWRFVFRKGGHPRLLVDLQSGIVHTEKELNEHVRACSVEFDPSRRKISGTMTVACWTERRFSFVIEFDRAWTVHEELSRREGEKAPRVVLAFEGSSPASTLGVKVALSCADVAAATRNLQAEIPDWDFAAARRRCESAWEGILGRFSLPGASERQKRIFYTALYHLFVQPNNLADVGARPFYSTLSLWDTYRAVHPLYTLIDPQLAAESVDSILTQFDRQGRLPVWPLWGRDTRCMIANHAVPVLADAVLKGLPVDRKRAAAAVLETLTKNHPGDRKPKWEWLEEYGFYPADKVPTWNASVTLEGAYDDACAARLTQVLGQSSAAGRFAARAALWTNQFDRTTGFMRGRFSDGSWREPFDEKAKGMMREKIKDFCEASAAVYTFHVQHDVERLIGLLGGRAAFIKRLDALFDDGLYSHDNEPSHHIPYLYALAGCPARTQERVHEICERNYGDGPGGIRGNEDCGQMSAWYLFSAMGFYPVDPCGGDYVLGAPQFPEIAVRLPGGKALRIVARNLSEVNRLVKRVTWNGRKVQGVTISHQDLTAGGELVFEMCAEPDLGDWKLAWADEFEGPGLDGAWAMERGMYRNQELQAYTTNAANVRIENGVLVLEARKESVPNVRFRKSGRSWPLNATSSEYTSGSVETKGRLSFPYGKTVVRAKLPKARGAWPAIWFVGESSVSNRWPRCGEIDLMEHVGYAPGVVSGDFHWWDPVASKEPNGHVSFGARRIKDIDMDAFHEFTMLRDENRISFFCDGRKYVDFCVDRATQPDGSNAFRQPMFIKLNFAVGGSWGGKMGVDEAAFPSRFEIDSVRFYEKAGEDPERRSFPNGTIGDYQHPDAHGDFGTDAFGWLEVRSDAPSPCVLRIGEQLNADGSVNVNPIGTIRGCTVTCEVSTVWSRVPFRADWRNTRGKNGVAKAIALPKDVGVIMPFRYVQKVKGPRLLDIRRVYVHWPMVCRVECPVADPDARKVWDFCQHTIVATSFAGIMVDGDRERIPYEGDIYINMLGQLYGVDGDPELSRRSIRHVLKYPTWPTEWKQHAIMCVWEDWHFTKSTGLAAECYEQLKREKLMLERARSDGLLPSDKSDLIDWPVGERDHYDMKTPCNAVVNAFHYRNLREMSDLATALGRADDARSFAIRAEKVQRRFNELFYDARQGLYVDGEGSRHSSLHANAAALAFGLVPGERQPKIADFIAKRGMVCSPYFAQYYLEALCKSGYKDVALRLMTAKGDRSWMGMIEQGATMTMEAWGQKAKPNQDWNHAWGTVPLNILARFFNDGTASCGRGGHPVSCRPRDPEEICPEKMRAVFDEVKTPYKYGMVLAPPKGFKYDNPMVFRHGGKWCMIFIQYDGKGYETHLATSNDLLHWEKQGPVLERGKPGAWDSEQADGMPMLMDVEWGGSNALGKFDNRYWMMYIGGANQGYETDPLLSGVAFADDPSKASLWTKWKGNPVLSPKDPDSRPFEKVTIYKHFAVEDPSRALGGRFIDFYNAKDVQGVEQVGIAVSDDMVTWRRYGADATIYDTRVGDPMIQKIGDVWVMFYYCVGRLCKGAFDTFACSHDLVHWTKWNGEPLVSPSEAWDSVHAHKPWVIKHDGIVYHFYNAVGKRGRGLALATSLDLRP